MEKISKLVKNEKDINYDLLIQIEEHARQYETAVDKKEFLKNVGAYEQKLILLNSSHPYEVLCYMEELDLPATKLILSELNYEEISKILYLFTTEDKKSFYKTFSDLDLVNHFIAYDHKADEYIDDLSIERKIDLLNSSDSQTVLASSKVFASIPDEDKQEIVSFIKTADGISALSNSQSYDNSDLVDNNINDDISDHEENNLDKVEEISEKQDITEQEQQEEKDKDDHEVDPDFDAKMTYFKINFEKYKLTNPELNDIDINSPDFHKLISTTLLMVIAEDFENYKKANPENNIVQKEQGQDLDETSKLEEFQQVKAQAEMDLIQTLKTQLTSNNIDLGQKNIEVPRTL